MKLHEWLATNGKTATWLAQETGLSASHISRLIERNGVAEKLPSIDTCVAISKATGGLVTANDFMPAPEPKSKRARPSQREVSRAA